MWKSDNIPLESDEIRAFITGDLPATKQFDRTYLANGPTGGLFGKEPKWEALADWAATDLTASVRPIHGDTLMLIPFFRVDGMAMPKEISAIIIELAPVQKIDHVMANSIRIVAGCDPACICQMLIEDPRMANWIVTPQKDGSIAMQPRHAR